MNPRSAASSCAAVMHQVGGLWAGSRYIRPVQHLRTPEEMMHSSSNVELAVLDVKSGGRQSHPLGAMNICISKFMAVHSVFVDILC